MSPGLTASVQPGSIIAGKFRVISQIGKGGMGVVVEAENLVTAKRVAIKSVRGGARNAAEAESRFLREARAAARIRHPNVVDVYDVIEDGDTMFMVMELLEGEPLSRVLARGDVCARELIALLLDAMRGVAAAHRKQVVHRDVKPDNIFLVRVSDRTQCIAKVVDFGISKIEEPGAEALTGSNVPLGTPMYMSYEQLAAARDVDVRTDVYSFGVILYQVLTGALPYEANTLAELIYKVLSVPPTPPTHLKPELPSALDAVVAKAMARDREERYPTIDALIAALTPYASETAWPDVCDSSLGRALQDTVPSQDRLAALSLQIDSRRVAGRPRRLLLGIAGTALAVGGAVAWQLYKVPASREPIAAPHVLEKKAHEPRNAAAPLQPTATSEQPPSAAPDESTAPPRLERAPSAGAQVPPPPNTKAAAKGVATAQKSKVAPSSVVQDKSEPLQGPELRAGWPTLKEF